MNIAEMKELAEWHDAAAKWYKTDSSHRDLGHLYANNSVRHAKSAEIIRFAIKVLEAEPVGSICTGNSDNGSCLSKMIIMPAAPTFGDDNDQS